MAPALVIRIETPAVSGAPQEPPVIVSWSPAALEVKSTVAVVVTAGRAVWLTVTFENVPAVTTFACVMRIWPPLTLAIV